MENVVFTKHARTRLQERKLLESMALETILYPDSIQHGKNQEFRKRLGQSTVTVIASKNDRNQWVILSCWIDPPLPGTKDFKEKKRYQAYQKAGFWGKIWISIKSQLGL